MQQRGQTTRAKSNTNYNQQKQFSKREPQYSNNEVKNLRSSEPQNFTKCATDEIGQNIIQEKNMLAIENQINSKDNKNSNNNIKSPEKHASRRNEDKQSPYHIKRQSSEKNSTRKNEFADKSKTEKN